MKPPRILAAFSLFDSHTSHRLRTRSRVRSRGGGQISASGGNRMQRDLCRRPVHVSGGGSTDLAGVLEQGGQGSPGCRAERSQRRPDPLRRPGEMPVALVVAEPSRAKDTATSFSHRVGFEVEEREFGEESLNYPFGIAEFEVDGFGRGEGQPPRCRRAQHRRRWPRRDRGLRRRRWHESSASEQLR